MTMYMYYKVLSATLFYIPKSLVGDESNELAFAAVNLLGTFSAIGTPGIAISYPSALIWKTTDSGVRKSYQPSKMLKQMGVPVIYKVTNPPAYPNLRFGIEGGTMNSTKGTIYMKYIVKLIGSTAAK